MSHLQCEHGRSAQKREVKTDPALPEILGVHRSHVNATSRGIGPKSLESSTISQTRQRLGEERQHDARTRFANKTHVH